jgi:large conductance mechanosensitive channel
MFKGFKDFLFRGNVIDLSVAVVIGAAFTDVVTAVTTSFLKPLIQLLSPGVGDFAGKFRVDGVVFDYASVINQTITFVITAAIVYFLVVAPMKAIQTRRLRGEESGPARPTDVELLTQIRDLLEDHVTAPAVGRTGHDGAAVPVEHVPATVGAADDAGRTRPVLAPTHRSAPARARTAPAPDRGHRAWPASSDPPPQYAEAAAGDAPRSARSRR